MSGQPGRKNLRPGIGPDICEVDRLARLGQSVSAFQVGNTVQARFG